MKYTLNPAVAICVGIAMTCVIGCAPTSQVTRTTTARTYDSANAPIAMTPIASASTTIVTSAGQDGSVQRRTTTTYASPY
jgi:hypothetical protein